MKGCIKHIEKTSHPCRLYNQDSSIRIYSSLKAMSKAGWDHAALQAALADECNSLLQKLKAEEEKTGSSAVSEKKAAGNPEGNEDSLDAFMSDVKVELEHSKVVYCWDGILLYQSLAKARRSCHLHLLPYLLPSPHDLWTKLRASNEMRPANRMPPISPLNEDEGVSEVHSLQAEHLRNELASLQTEIRKLEGLLKHADPDGYYKEGTHAANVAKQKGLRLYNKDKEEEALRKRKKQEAVRLSQLYDESDFPDANFETGLFQISTKRLSAMSESPSQCVLLCEARTMCHFCMSRKLCKLYLAPIYFWTSPYWLVSQNMWSTGTAVSWLLDASTGW